MATPPVSTVRAGPRETGARAGPSDSSDRNPTCVPATNKSTQATTAMTQDGTAVASEFGLTLALTSCLRIPVSCQGGGRRESLRQFIGPFHYLRRSTGKERLSRAAPPPW